MNSSCEDRVYVQLSLLTRSVTAPLTLRVRSDASWCVYVYNSEVKNISDELKELPVNITDQTIDQFCQKFKCLNICAGNENCEDVIERRVDCKEPFAGSSGDRIAWIEATVGRSKLLKENFDVISVNIYQVIRYVNLIKHSTATCINTKQELLAKKTFLMIHTPTFGICHYKSCKIE